jgi:hypothetical protein
MNLLQQSIFTDKGPISKPPLTVQSGTGATVQNPTDVTLPGAAILPAHVGLYVTLSGSPTNASTYRIASRLSATQVRLSADLTIPDNGTYTWVVFDPRDGQIADSPADVTVRVNGSPVTPLSVNGLLGQVVLSAIPAPTDSVVVDYSWVDNPTVEFRALNALEFRLNSWNRDQGQIAPSQHIYRYNNVLTTPSLYQQGDVQAWLDQPLAREMHYRAYERAYSALLNDPNLLLLNSPIHKIAYPPMSREVNASFIRYEADVLPESDPTPWTRHGTGIATTSGGILTVVDNSGGAFPYGNPVYWTQDIDISFDCILAVSWRGTLDVVTASEGVFTGVACGYSDPEKALVIGFLIDGGVRKVGILKKDGGKNPGDILSWGGGLDPSGTATGLPVVFDWTALHSYRIYRDRDGTARFYYDGGVVATLQSVPSDLPYLSELNAPFDSLEGVFFGSLSRPAQTSSSWDFVRYLIQPTNPYQVAPSIFVSYEGNENPEDSDHPWTPVGSHGVEVIQGGDYLVLGSTSATDQATESMVGLIDGDFRGFLRLEPLLAAASRVDLDVNVQLRYATHGITNNAATVAIDDGDRLIQLSFFPDQSSPKLSYGGRCIPTDFTPWNWVVDSGGAASAVMVGQMLQITSPVAGAWINYTLADLAPPGSDARVLWRDNDYVLEFRCRVVSHSGPTDYQGVYADADDGYRYVGAYLAEAAGVRQIVLHSLGTGKATFNFEWFDGKPHTYRLVKNTSANLVTLFVDSVYIGSTAYSNFDLSPGVAGSLTFGCGINGFSDAASVVLWDYANAWRFNASPRRYVGIWKGSNADSLVGYHLPLKTAGRNADVAGNTITDSSNNFIAIGVVAGDQVVIDDGLNQGTYEVVTVGMNQLTFSTPFPSQPSKTAYRIVKQTDWSIPHKYRIFRSPIGTVSLLLDSEPEPLIEIGYDSTTLPAASSSLFHTMSTGLPCVVFGAFDSQNLSETSWDFVRYGVTRSPTELRIAPHHEFINQWNVIASPEHLRTPLVHDHTGFMSASTGIPPEFDPDFLRDPNLIAYTVLNDSTPLMPATQTYEIRRPQPTLVPFSGLGRPEDVLNTNLDFVLNDGRSRIEIVVPDDVLYTSLDVIEQDTGVPELLAPFYDRWEDMRFDQIGKSCFGYTGSILPELDPTAPLPWRLLADQPGQVIAQPILSTLNFGTGPLGTRAAYVNPTPIPDVRSLRNETVFRIRVGADTSLGTGDTHMRFGVVSTDIAIGLGFLTSEDGRRYVLAYDLTNGNVVGGLSFDFMDGQTHTYRIIRDPNTQMVEVRADS